nr:MAG TPA: hypothetical protein [Caudoviricetes sp.]
MEFCIIRISILIAVQFTRIFLYIFILVDL